MSIEKSSSGENILNEFPDVLCGYGLLTEYKNKINYTFFFSHVVHAPRKFANNIKGTNKYEINRNGG